MSGRQRAAKRADCPSCKTGAHKAHVVGTDEAILCGTGRAAYLLVRAGGWDRDGRVIDGAATLRKLAKAILAEVGDG